ncbi:hypothetical protein FACS189418_5800 [Clostridia bacterium]|nr:hypothetical protein FACS189418_5800 [Clostridia bacterium]
MPKFSLSGQFTVLFSLLWMSVCSLLVVLLACARMNTMQYRMEESVSSVLSSLFSRYEKNLFERYGIFAFALSEEKIEQYIRKDLEAYAQSDSWSAWEVEDVSILEMSGVSDSFGVYLEEAAKLVSSDGNFALGMLKKLEGWIGWVKKSESIPVEKLSQDSVSKMQEQLLQSEQTNFMDVLTQWMGKISLSFLEEEKYSPFTLSQKDKVSRNFNSSSWDNSISQSTFLDRYLWNQYIQNHFSHFLNAKNQEQKTQLLYEQEYILGGALSDKENLQQIAGKIFTLREVMNGISFLQDQKKKNETKALAAVLSLIFAVPELTGIIEHAIRVLWINTESEMDVQALLSGKKVWFYKNAHQWRSKWQDIFWVKEPINEIQSNQQLPVRQKDDFIASKILIQKMNVEIAREEDEAKDIQNLGELSYINYLSIFLALENPLEQRYRVMDLIQSNLRMEIPNFSLEHSYYAMEVSCHFRYLGDKEYWISKKRKYH